MICFKKGSASIEVDSTNIKNVNFGFDLQFELMDDSVYYCSVPELNIHFYTEDDTKINLLASQHVESFFKFWLLSKSFNDFLKHMLDLGFVIRNSVKIKKKVSKKSAFITTRHIQEENFVFA